MNTTVIDEYKNGKSLAFLNKKYGISCYKLKKILNKNGVTIRCKEEQNKYSPQNQRKYTIDDNYLDEIDSTKAYFIGFLAADGNIQKDGGIKIGLSSIDRDFLECMKKELSASYPIKDYETKDGFKVSEFKFRSQQIKKHLEDYGIIQRKTYSFTFPKNFPQEFLIDFLFGYWDGDGTFCTAGKAKRASLCSYKKDFLEDIIKFLSDNYNIPSVKVSKIKNKELYTIQYSTNSAKMLSDIFESRKTRLYLERKHQKRKQLFYDIKSQETVALNQE